MLRQKRNIGHFAEYPEKQHTDTLNYLHSFICPYYSLNNFIIFSTTGLALFSLSNSNG
jgi:hypothetical protein